MKISRDFGQKKLKLEDKEKTPQKDKKKNRKATLILFFGTVFISLAFWLRPKVGLLWQNLFKPATYQVGKPAGQKSLEDFIGFKPDLNDREGLLRSINLLLEGIRGKYGIYINDLLKKESFGINEDEVFIAASVNKVPIMVTFYQQVEKGKLKEDDEYYLKQKDIQDYGTGVMRYERPGKTYTYSQLVELIGKQSDNTAAYVLEEIIGRKNVQDLIDKLNMKNTSMEENTTTPKEMGDFLVKLYSGDLLKKENTQKIFAALTDTDFEDRITLGVPEGVKVAHKIGNEIQTYNDCGVIFGPKPYVLCILTSEVAENEALEVVPKISRLVWEFESQ